MVENKDLEARAKSIESSANWDAGGYVSRSGAVIKNDKIDYSSASVKYAEAAKAYENAGDTVKAGEMESKAENCARWDEEITKEFLERAETADANRLMQDYRWQAEQRSKK